MADFTFLDNDILIDGVSSAKVAGTLKVAGLAEHRIGEIIGYWFVGATGRTRPAPFDFTTDVQAHDPDCEITYAREFEHSDWMDGEDRVQASATPEELGFNARFHAIENEFDRIADQFRRLGACAKELRADLVGVTREIESKLTALENDLFELRRDALPEKPSGGGLGVLGTVKVGEKQAFITNVGDDFQLFEFAGTSLGGSIRDKVLPDFGRGEVFRPDDVRPDELVDLLGGVEDLVTIPQIRELVERPGGATVADVRAVAGGVVLPSGHTLASVVAAMAADTRLEGVGGTVEAIAAHVVGVLPQATVTATTTEVFTDERLRRGSARTVRAAEASGIGVEATTLRTLATAGVDVTVGGLAGATTAELAGRLAESGAAVDTTALRSAVARARLATAIRGVGR